jgi:putative membrane protein
MAIMMDSGWWIVMPIMMVVFWGGVIALVVWVVRQFKGDRASGHSPLDIAKERRAKGEISQDELEEIKRDLA